MNWKGCGRKRSWPDVKLNHGTCFGSPRKITMNFSHGKTPDLKFRHVACNTVLVGNWM
jgi:hypothetical protein